MLLSIKFECFCGQQSWVCLGKQLSSSWLQWWGESLVNIREAFDVVLEPFSQQENMICYFTSGGGILVWCVTQLA